MTLYHWAGKYSIGYQRAAVPYGTLYVRIISDSIGSGCLNREDTEQSAD